MVDQNIDEFATLEKNWDSYGADPIGAEAIEVAKKFQALVRTKCTAMPSPDGGVSFEWHNDAKRLSMVVDFNKDGKLEEFYLHLDKYEVDLYDA